MRIIKSNRFTVLSACMFTGLLSACGGGGGEASSTPATPTAAPAPAPASTPSPAPAPVSPPTYLPDESKLTTTAEGSADLYVDPGFNFTSSRDVHLDIAVYDTLNQPISGVFISVFSLWDPLAEEPEPQLVDKKLVGRYRTDAAGKLLTALSIPVEIRTMVVHVEKMGFENSQTWTLDDGNYVTMTFSPQ